MLNPKLIVTFDAAIDCPVSLSYTYHIYSSPTWNPLSRPASAPQAAIDVVEPSQVAIPPRDNSPSALV